MTDFLVGAACFLLAMLAFGLFGILRRPDETSRMMAAQFLGTGGVAILLLLSVVTRTPSIIDVALILALLAAFAGIAFVRGGAADTGDKITEAGCE